MDIQKPVVRYDVVILLTCAVNVKGMVFLALQDAVIRENHYLEAISFYYRMTDLPIIMVENTGHDFAGKLSEEMQNSNRIECLTFNGNNFPKELGKGYGEMESIAYAMENSKLIDDDTTVIKVTGRYKVVNIPAFVKSAKNQKLNKCQFMYFKGQPKAFSGIFTFSRDFIVSYLDKNHAMMNDTKGVYFEHVLAFTILEYLVAGHTYSFLPVYPRLSGISGTENMQHRTDNYSFWIKRNLLYKIVKANYRVLDMLIMRYFQ